VGGSVDFTVDRYLCSFSRLISDSSFSFLSPAVVSFPLWFDDFVPVVFLVDLRRIGVCSFPIWFSCHAAVFSNVVRPVISQLPFFFPFPFRGNSTF